MIKSKRESCKCYMDYLKAVREWINTQQSAYNLSAPQEKNLRVGANVAGAHALANKNAAKQEGENGLTDKDHKRITDYQEKVVSLGEHLNLTQNIIDQARLSLCEKLVIAQNIHEEGKRLLPRRSRGGLLTTAQRPPPHAVHCNAPADDRCFALRAAGREPGKDSSRLAQFKGQKSTALVAAALLKKSMRDHDVDRMFEELKNALIHSEGLGAVYVVCMSQLVHQAFAWSKTGPRRPGVPMKAPRYPVKLQKTKKH